MAEAIPIIRLPRILPKEMVEQHALFICRSAASMALDTPTRRACLEQLCRSENAAIASEALRLMAPLRILK